MVRLCCGMPAPGKMILVPLVAMAVRGGVLHIVVHDILSSVTTVHCLTIHAIRMNQTMKGGSGNTGTAQKEGEIEEGVGSQKPLWLNTIVPAQR